MAKYILGGALFMKYFVEPGSNILFNILRGVGGQQLDAPALLRQLTNAAAAQTFSGHKLPTNSQYVEMTKFASPYAQFVDSYVTPDTPVDFEKRYENVEKFEELTKQMNGYTLMEHMLLEEQKWDLKKLGALEQQYKDLLEMQKVDPENQTTAYHLYENSDARRILKEDLKFTEEILEKKFGRKGIYNGTITND